MHASLDVVADLDLGEGTEIPVSPRYQYPCVCVCVCARARARTRVYCIHTHKHMCICIRFLVEGKSEYSRSVLGYLNNGTTAIFIAVVGTSLIWNFNAGLAELEAMKAEALAEAEGGVSKLDLFAVVCAVKLINKCVRNRIAMRYNWDQVCILLLI